ncbi:cell division protein ZapE [Rhodoblastus acidophilus]|uniref:Cell division protein ZapE n=1 Tax=Candidatus Rhodoblastus alkanivorans TaxID=2954117 RepID=A0ABS9Z183_9HYPH|nr:cell division protein ZapE [Candidatus Rhodoblastus alkanivorans]MCI4678514.1 cell division protein ZapE [Candidatus Rhodoblastus alkanivorans]MCI4681398.1 cell division protein ZapE [Candidatus Rhodoblastus alkanivorans]MDI4642446.1 cell division protein ZapE [Rhodoblastus acidophilus]
MEHSRRSIIDEYDDLVAQGRIERDAKQMAVVEKLDALGVSLTERRLAKKSSSLGWLFGARNVTAPTARGLYVWGLVGRGKTMLMDLFFDSIAIEKKRRVHFHAFMADVHKRIFAWRQKRKTGEVKGEDPIAPVASELIDEAILLCFDEFAVTDIADAMILGRLFEALWARGMVVVATSNVDPADLYMDGLNRALFLPFIGMIKKNMEVVRLDARTDFRLEKLSGAPVYLTPPDAEARAALDKAFHALTGVKNAASLRLPVMGREIVVPQASGRVARFDYADLCKQPLGAADFVAIAEYFHVLVVDNIPTINADERNEAKRFINLIDGLYDQRVKLIASADVEPEKIYQAEQGWEAFEFARTVSRLTEMRSTQYLELPHGRGEKVSGDITGLVET